MAIKHKKAGVPCLVVGLAVALGWWAKAQVDGIDARADLLTETGTAVIQMLQVCQAGIQDADLGAILSCYDDGYASEREGFWAERLESERDGVRLLEWHTEGARRFDKADVAEQYARYLRSGRKIETCGFKLNQVEELSGRGAVVIRSILGVRGREAGGQVFETHAHFRMWLRKVGGSWKIRKQELLHGETVVGDGRGFTDVTAAAGLDFRARHNPAFDTPEWDPKKFGIVRYASAGVAAADYDNDGWYDIFFADGAAARLYRNNGDGTFTDATAAAGLPTDLAGVNVAVFADFNNDGHKDLFLGCITGVNRLYRNNGDGTFTDVTEGAGLGGYFVTVAAAADYDNDGKLDLYIGRYLDPRTKLPTTLFYTRNSEGNTLLRNEGNFRFTDVTARAGVREGGLTLGVAWGDYDGDGFQDLFVANDFGRSVLFHNNGDGTFTDVSKQTGALDFGYGMSATFGDINNDAKLDIYISKVHSGQRWYGHASTLHRYLLTSFRQRTLHQDFPLYYELFSFLGADWHRHGDRVIRGNSLLLNDGRGKYADVAEAARANPLGWYWGSAMVDFDNDGLQDIYAVNGWITAESKQDL